MKRERKMKAVDYIRKGWTQHVLARKAHGSSCRPEVPEAVRWCALGAIVAACGYISMKNSKAVGKLCAVLGIRDSQLVEWNDAPSRTKSQVLAAFEKAGI